MMRDKKRYVLVETSIKISEDERGFSHSLYKELIRCIGEINYHNVNPKFIKFVGQNRFIIRASLDGTAELILAFALIKKIGDKEISFYTLKSSGTIKALGSFNL
ncbi:MAG: Rpp14/Pop5 family protein [Candidatus Micrarchaeales archaeon]